jgi:hypothetical protein
MPADSGAVASTASALLVSRKETVPVGEVDPADDDPPETCAVRVQSSPIEDAEMLVTLGVGPLTSSKEALDELPE